MNQRSGHEAPPVDGTGTGRQERGLRALARVALAVLAYLVGFLLLDFATEGVQGTLQVSLWFPPAGLTFAFLLVFGWRFAAAVAPAFLLHLVLFRGGVGYPLAMLLLLPIAYAAVYAGAAALLLRVAKIDPRLPRMRDVAWFVGVACLLAPALVAAPVVSGFVVGGYSTVGTFREDLLGFWAGDATGVAVLAPLLLVAMRPFPSLWAGLPERMRGTEANGLRVPSRQELPEALLQVLVLALVLAAAYGVSRGVSLDYAYLTFAPVVWIALRGGFERTVLALLVANVGVVVLAGQTTGGDDPALLQFGLITLTLVGLTLGSQRSEQERTERALRSSERRFRSVVQNSSEVIEICDPNGTLRYASPSHRELFGYAPEKAVGTSVLDRVHPDDLPSVLEETDRATNGAGRAESVAEYRVRHADGSWRWVESVGTYLTDDPAVGGVVVNVRDVTERKASEEALRESEERYRAVVELSVEPIYIYDAETKRVFESNEAFREMMGYTGEELLGMEIYEFIAHDREDIDRRISRSLKVQGRHIGERNYRRKDGSLVVVQTSSSVMPYGGRTAICAVSRDVTGLKQTREKLEESERRFRSMIQNAPDAISVLNADSTVRYDSPAIERLLGYAPEERIGRKGIDYVHPEDRETARRTLSEVLDNPGVRLPVEYRLRHKDGSWRYFEAARTNLLEDPAVGGIVLNYRDVTERKRAERALQRSERHFRTVVESLGEGLLITDLDDVVLDANSRMAELTGYTREEMIGKTAYTLFLPPDSRRAAIERNGRRARGVRERYESRYLHKDGTSFWGQVHAVPYRDPDSGEVIGTIGAIVDVTERREAEEALKESEVRHRRQARELSLLHQVRTILARELDPSAVFHAVVGAVAETYGYVLVSAYRLEGGAGQGELILQHQVGYRTVIERVPTSEGVMGRVARTGRSVLLEDAQADPAFLGAIEDIVSEVCVPLLDGDEVIGTLNVESTGGEALNEDDLRLLEAVGEHAGMALAQASLHGRIKEAEQRYRVLVENVPAVVYIDAADETNSVIYRSPYVRDVLGYEPEDFLSHPEFWQKLLHPGDRERVLAENERTNRTGEPFRIEYRMIHKAGHPVWLRDEAVLIRDESGSPKFWQGYFVDVTERKAAERRLREAEVRYRTMVEEVPAITYMHAQRPGGASSTLYISPQIETVLGYTPEDYMDNPEFWMSVVHPDDRARVIAEDERTGETGEPFRMEFRKIARDGRAVWLREEGRLVGQEEDGSQVWHGVMFDISELKRAEEELQRERNLLRTVMDSAQDAVFVKDIEHRFVLNNRAHQRILGAEGQEDILGKTNADYWGEERAAPHHADDRRVIDAGEIIVGREEQIDHAGFGERRWISTTKVPLRGPDDSIEGLVAVSRDVTEKRRAEEALRESEEWLRQLMEQAADAMIVHDPEGRITDVNRRASETLGYTRGELLGMSVPDVEVNYRSGGMRGLWERLVPGRSVTVNGLHRRKDGTTFPVEVRVGLLESGGQRLLLAICRDVTERKKAEESLRRSEDRFRQLFEQSADTILLHDEEGKMVDCNEEACRSMGYSKEELLGMTVRDFVAEGLLTEEERRARGSDTPWRRAAAGEPGEVVGHHRGRHRRKDGTTFPVEVAVGSMEYEGRRLILAAARDITAREQAERALASTASRLSSLIESMPSGILVEDSSRRVRHVNEGLCEMFGIGESPQELIDADCAKAAEDVMDLFVEPERFVEGIEEILEQRRMVINEELPLADGRVFKRDYVPVFVGGEYEGHLWHYRDITERKRAEEALRESEERFRQLFENSVEALLVHDERGRYVDCNAQACRLYGYSREELLGLSVSDLSCEMLTEEERAEKEGEGGTPWQRALSGEPGVFSFGFEEENRRKDGTTFPVEVRLGGVDYGGRRLMLVAARDVTERKRSEEEVREANRRLSDLAVLKADFTAMVAHELDTPLAVIRGYADILAAGLGDLEPGVRERALSRIRSETETLDALVADVRSAASSERSDFDVEPGPVPLGGLLSDAAAFAETLPDGQRLRVVPGEGAGEDEMVLADRERIGQVLRNLLSNAVKYSPEGAPVELRTSRAENPGRVRVEVADRGSGIRPEDLRRIFEKFGRGRGDSNQKVGGLGLGLYLSRRIIRAHGGELTVDAGPHGDGSVFGFDLEAADE